MNPTSTLLLYIKPLCPWCVSARRHLDERGYRYETVDITQSPDAAAEMRRLSGQGLVPTLVAGELVLADFGPEELAEFLDRHSIRP